MYPTTFVAASGTVPTNISDNQIVVGARVIDPQLNGTGFSMQATTLDVVWTNATTLPVVNETYMAQVSGVLAKIGGFGIGGPSDTGVYMPLSKAESFFEQTNVT